MTMLERSGEERSRRRQRLELGAVVAEADDDRASVDVAHRVEQHMDALVVEQLSEVDDRGLVSREELREALGVPFVRQPLAHAAGFAGSRKASASSPATASSRDLGRDSSTSTPGGISCTRST